MTQPAIARPVFVSYARNESAAYALALLDELGADQVFLDTSEPDYGTDFTERILRNVLGARVVVVFATASYFERWYCQKEWQLALSPYIRALDSRRRGDVGRESAHVVVALDPGGVPEGVRRRLSPALKKTAWPGANDTSEIAALIRRQLDDTPDSIGARLDARGLLASVEEEYRSTEGVPRSLKIQDGRHFPEVFPAPLAGRFVGREDELWQIQNLLSPLGDPKTSSAVTVAIQASAGFGKTWLAREFVQRYGPALYPGGLFWIDADVSGEALEGQWHGILSQFVPDLPPLAAMREAARDVRAELAQEFTSLPMGQAVLVVVDSIPETGPSESPRTLDHWWPALGQASVLATSRAPVTASGTVRTIRLDVLNAEAARTVLTRGVAHRQTFPEELWDDATRAVGNHPLALGLLNRCLVLGAMTPPELLGRLTEATTRTIDKHVEALRGHVPDELLPGIGETFSVTYDNLGEEAQLAARAFAFTAPARVPPVVWERICEKAGGAATRVALQARTLVLPWADEDGANDDSGWEMHRLLADYVRSRAQGVGAWALAVTSLAEALTEESARDSKRRAETLPCSACLSQVLKQRQWTPEELAKTVGPEELAALGGRLDETARRLYVLGLVAGENEPLHTAVRACSVALELLTREEHPYGWAATHNDLGNSLSRLGVRQGATIDLQDSLRAHQKALEVFTRDAYPNDWARVQANLGRAFVTLGERVQDRGHLESAVDAFRKSLEIHSIDNDPVEWAGCRSSLGGALMRLGERSEDTAHLSEAVEASRDALQVYSLEETPFEWALAQNQLGNALHSLSDRIDSDSHHEHAIEAFQSALKGATRERAPLDWARTQNNLGLALKCIGTRQGDKARLKQAVEVFNLALEVRTRERVPLQWAQTRCNLGYAFLGLSQCEEDATLPDNALKAFREARSAYSREETPLQWAYASLGIARALHGLGEREQGVSSLSNAAAECRGVLEVYSGAGNAMERAAAQTTLALVLFRIGERTGGAADYDETIELCRAALEVQHPVNAPHDWARTQSTLGLAHLRRGEKNNQRADLQDAVEAFQACLQVRNPENGAVPWAATMSDLGITFLALGALGSDRAMFEQAAAAIGEGLRVIERSEAPRLWDAMHGNLALVAKRHNDLAQGPPHSTAGRAPKAWLRLVRGALPFLQSTLRLARVLSVPVVVIVLALAVSLLTGSTTGAILSVVAAAVLLVFWASWVSAKARANPHPVVGAIISMAMAAIATILFVRADAWWGRVIGGVLAGLALIGASSSISRRR